MRLRCDYDKTCQSNCDTKILSHSNYYHRFSSFRVLSFRSTFTNLVFSFMFFLFQACSKNSLTVCRFTIFLLGFRFCSVLCVFVLSFTGFSIIAHHDCFICVLCTSMSFCSLSATSYSSDYPNTAHPLLYHTYSQILTSHRHSISYLSAFHLPKHHLLMPSFSHCVSFPLRGH